MTNTPPAYLPLSADMALLLQIIHRDNVIPNWATKAMLGRARNLGLLSQDTNGFTLTATGEAVAVITDAHSYRTGHNHPGRIGVKGRCRCGDWTWGTNENGHDGQRRVRDAFTAHLAELISEYLTETSPAVVAAEGYENH